MNPHSVLHWLARSGPCPASLIPLPNPTPPLSLWSALLQPHWPCFSVPLTPSLLLPQDFCTCHSLTWNLLLPKPEHGWLLVKLQVPLICHLTHMRSPSYGLLLATTKLVLLTLLFYFILGPRTVLQWNEAGETTGVLTQTLGSLGQFALPPWASVSPSIQVRGWTLENA